MDTFTYKDTPLPDGGTLRLLLSESGSLLGESKLDSTGREVERIDYDPKGSVVDRTVYEYALETDRKPKTTLAYDRDGRLWMRHDRGQRPVFFQTKSGPVGPREG